MGLFNERGGDGAHSCPTQDLSEQAQEPAVGGMSFYTFNMIISGASAAFVIVVILAFMMMHATHFSNPKHQGNIMRVALFIPIYVLISWLSLAFPVVYPYIKPWVHFFEAWSLCSFFLLLCEYLAPNHRERDAYLAAKNIPKKKGTVQGHKWFQVRWILVFQYPVVAFLVAILTDITQAAGVYCIFSGGIHFAKFWLHLFNMISLVLVFLTLLQVFKHLKPELAVHNAMLKFIAFKIIIFLTVVQSIILWILEDHTDVMNPSSTMTWADLHIGIPNMLPCLEMVPLSLFFVWAYHWGTYSKSRKADDESDSAVPHYQGGFLGRRAFLEMLNPSGLFRGIIHAFRLVFRKSV